MTAQRQQFEQWYACNAFNYERDPIGSRNCGLQWDAWKSAQAHMVDAATLTKCNQIIHTQKLAIEAMQTDPFRLLFDNALKVTKDSSRYTLTAKLYKNGGALFIENTSLTLDGKTL